MTSKYSYQRIARRSLMASDSLLQNSNQENAAFMAYHAFESTGCALSDSLNLPVGGGVSHSTKIKLFNHAARRVGKQQRVAALTVELKNLRNTLLYPLVDNQNQPIRTPEQVITLIQARKLKGRVQGIVNWVDQKI
jgi:hypothetical protein